MKKALLCGLFLSYALSLNAAEIEKPASELPKITILKLTSEQAAALPQILDIAIKQMGLSPGSVAALQIAQSLAVAQQSVPPLSEKPTK